MLRTGTEEFLLASQYRKNDELAAEFIRTFRHTFFHGLHYIKRYDALSQSHETVPMSTLLPKAAYAADVVDQTSLYGFRGTDPRVRYLSPWEFIQWWFPHRLRAPSSDYPWTRPAQGQKRTADGGSDAAKKSMPGLDFVLDEAVVSKSKMLMAFPKRMGLFSEAAQRNVFSKYAAN